MPYRLAAILPVYLALYALCYALSCVLAYSGVAASCASNADMRRANRSARSSPRRTAMR